MTPRELAWMWLGAFAYVGAFVGEIFFFQWLLGDAVGGVVGFVVAIVPLIAWSFWSLR